MKSRDDKTFHTFPEERFIVWFAACICGTVCGTFIYLQSSKTFSLVLTLYSQSMSDPMNEKDF